MRRFSLAHVALAALALGSTGCATMFRQTSTTVRIESTPDGAEAHVKNEKPRKTPSEITVSRSGLTEVEVVQPGYEEHRGVVRKSVNGWWLFSDIATCIVPVFVCVPLIADAVSGAWNDVQPRYVARLVPAPDATPSPYAQAAPMPRVAPRVVEPPPTEASSSMSDSERRAAARAAYQEGIELESQRKYAAAIERFQVAQKLFDAPPNLVHLAQCYAATGKLVEAFETYETLTHKTPSREDPPQFHDAVATGKKELAALTPRIPTLVIQVQPAPSTLRNLSVVVNGRTMPVELVGIARPVNPGHYEITATAWGIAAAKPVTFDLAEGENRTTEIRLGK